MVPQRPRSAVSPFKKGLGVVLVALYSLQNLIPGIGAVPRIALLPVAVAFTVLVMALFWRDLFRDLQLFLDEFLSYLRFLLLRLVLFFPVYLAVALILAAIVGDAAANQEILASLDLPVLAFLALVYAPLLEEILYRGFLRRAIDGDALFIAVSTLIFAAIHMLHPGQTPLQTLYIIEYALLGAFLALLYVKTNNIFVTIAAHFALNAVAFLPFLAM